MKKDYQRPSVKTHSVELNQMVCQSVHTATTNAGLNYDGGNNGVARGREGGNWDDE